MQYMTENVEWQNGTRAVVNCVMGWGNEGMVPLEFGCTVGLQVVQKSTVRSTILQ